MSRDTPRPGFGTRRTLSPAALLHSARYSGGFSDKDGDPGEHGNAALVQYGLNPTVIVYISVSSRIARAAQARAAAMPTEEYPTEADLACEA